MNMKLPVVVTPPYIYQLLISTNMLSLRTHMSSESFPSQCRDLTITRREQLMIKYGESL